MLLSGMEKIGNGTKTWIIYLINFRHNQFLSLFDTSKFYWGKKESTISKKFLYYNIILFKMKNFSILEE